jgi:hypothetical protein
MKLRIVTATAAFLLAASGAAAQGISDEPPGRPKGLVAEAIPSEAADPFASIVIEKTVRRTPPPESIAPRDPAASSPPYIGPGLTIVAPVREQDTASDLAVPNSHAAVDAGPTFIPTTSTFVLQRPGYDEAAGR